jgi:8-oxo-dGTP pyrophosphatase MutT (NUDIX family)
MTAYKEVGVSFIIPVREDGKIMMGIKKVGLGEGKITLFGGKIEKKESPQQAAIRELAEEAHVRPGDGLKHYGHLTMDIQNLRIRIVADVFRCNGVIGDASESYEMTVEWIPINDIPYAKMWADNQYWFPYLLKCEPFEGEFTFADPDTLTSHSVRPRTPRTLESLVAALKSPAVASPRRPGMDIPPNLNI